MRRVVIDDQPNRSQRGNDRYQGLKQGGSHGRSERQRICDDCGDPSQFTKKIENKWICDSCIFRKREANKSEEYTQEHRDIAYVMKNKDD